LAIGQFGKWAIGRFGNWAIGQFGNWAIGQFGYWETMQLGNGAVLFQPQPWALDIEPRTSNREPSECPKRSEMA